MSSEIPAVPLHQNIEPEYSQSYSNATTTPLQRFSNPRVAKAAERKRKEDGRMVKQSFGGNVQKKNKLKPTTMDSKPHTIINNKCIKKSTLLHFE